jgi:hypothetical protein
MLQHLFFWSAIFCYVFGVISIIESFGAGSMNEGMLCFIAGNSFFYIFAKLLED